MGKDKEFNNKKTVELNMYIRIGHHHNALQILTESFDSIVLDHNEGGCHEETGCRSLKYKAPHGHRVRRGNTKENMQSCKFSF